MYSPKEFRAVCSKVLNDFPDKNTNKKYLGGCQLSVWKILFLAEISQLAFRSL
jgi:hypothetical protein